MNTLELLQTRRSNKKLTAPAPSAEQLEEIFQAAMRAPDHGKLQPYQFIVIEKTGLERLSQLLKDAVTELNLDEKQAVKAEKFVDMPMVIAVVAKLDETIGKVPTWEQLLTAGCATYGIQLAAQTLGFDSYWATGKWSEGTALRQAFGCESQDKIVALLTIGTAEEPIEKSPRLVKLENFVRYL